MGLLRAIVVAHYKLVMTPLIAFLIAVLRWFISYFIFRFHLTAKAFGVFLLAKPTKGHCLSPATYASLDNREWNIMLNTDPVIRQVERYFYR